MDAVQAIRTARGCKAMFQDGRATLECLDACWEQDEEPELVLETFLGLEQVHELEQAPELEQVPEVEQVPELEQEPVAGKAGTGGPASKDGSFALELELELES